MTSDSQADTTLAEEIESAEQTQKSFDYVHNASYVRWYEIDDENDLKYAEKQIITKLEKYRKQ